MELVYIDDDILVCLKPARVLSTDEPGGVPDLCREALGDPKADVRTVHRLDRVVAGLMVLARNAKAASELSRQIREDEFEKEYQAVVHGVTEEKATLRDLLGRGKRRAAHKVNPQTIHFKKTQKEVQQRKGYLHKCAVCGVTDADDPNKEFRYCSKCNGYYCYCMDHINNHVHIQ